jgi:hypothetical protein
MYELLLALGVVLFALVKAREHFRVSGGVRGQFKPEEKGTWTEYVPHVTTDEETTGGKEVVSTWPSDTCCPQTPELQAGLCYERCKPGFHGVGPVCWADTINVGVGIPVGLNPCPNGWNNDGLICREPVWNDCSWRGLFKECWGRLRGGNLLGRLNKFCPDPFRHGGNGYDTSDADCRWPDNVTVFPASLRPYAIRMRGKRYPKTMGVCAGRGAYSNEHIDYVDGLCYRPCTDPVLRERVPGMPYLCYKGEGLSYGRGAGKIPKAARIFGECWSPF